MSNKIINIAFKIIVAIIILYIILTFGVRLVGIKPYIVSSGSMEPAFHVRSVVYTKKVDCRTLQEGDAISFTLENGTMVTHRIHEIKYDGDSPVFITKGDANRIVDLGEVREEQIEGKVVFNVPYLGYVLEFVQTRNGKIIIIAFVLILFLSTKLYKLLKSD